MAIVGKTILESAQAIKEAMNDIHAAAVTSVDVTPYLDEKGRLPFANLLPLVKDSSNGVPLVVKRLISSMGRTDYPILCEGELTSASRIRDEARMYAYNRTRKDRTERSLFINNCTHIGTHAFYNTPLSGVDYLPNDYCDLYGYESAGDSYSLLRLNIKDLNTETIAEEAFFGVPLNAEFYSVKSIGARAFWGTGQRHKSNLCTCTFHGKVGHIAQNAFEPYVIREVVGLDAKRVQEIDEFGYPRWVQYYRDRYWEVCYCTSHVRFTGMTTKEIQAMPGFPFGLKRYSNSRYNMDGHNAGTFVPEIICSDGTLTPTETVRLNTSVGEWERIPG